MNGNVGIGTTGPDVSLVVAKSNTWSEMGLRTYDDGAANSIFTFQKSDTDTVGTNTETDDGDMLGEIDFKGVDSGGGVDHGAIISVTQSGASGAKVPTKMQLSTFSTTAQNVGLVIDNAGNVGIGTSTPLSTLDVLGSAAGILMRAGASPATVQRATSTTADIQLAAADKISLFANSYSLTVSGTGDGVLKMTSYGNLTLDTSQNNANILLLPGTGNVGIGTTGPGATLDILPTTASYFTSGLKVQRDGTPTQYGTFELQRWCVKPYVC